MPAVSVIIGSPYKIFCERDSRDTGKIWGRKDVKFISIQNNLVQKTLRYSFFCKDFLTNQLNTSISHFRTAISSNILIMNDEIPPGQY